MDERKLIILSAIVDEYIKTGEPVGSKVLASLTNLSVSSATIRNEMAALEQQGFLEQPHTSAGRIPSFKGYRLYIDRLMSPQPLTKNERAMIDDIFDDELAQGAVISQASKALAELTRCTSVVTDASPQFSVITKVEVIPTGNRLYMLLLITSGGNVKNKICRLQFDLNSSHLDFFKNFVNDNLQGVKVENLSPARIQTLATALGSYVLALSPLLYAVYEMSAELRSTSVDLEGATRLLACDELDPREIMRFIESKNELASLLNESFSGIHVLFGKEKDTFVISNSSLIMGSYSKNHEKAGSMGIIGPIRINYAKIIPYIEYLTDRVSTLLTKQEEENKTDE